MKIQLVNPKGMVRVKCPNCQEWLRAELHSDEKERWIIIRECYRCGFRKILKKEELDIIQPNSPLFKLLYKDPFKEREIRKKEADWQEEKRKEALDEKYDKQFKKPWERKFVKDKVLKGGI